MALSIDQLPVKTTLDDTDILHLRQIDRIDKQITYPDLLVKLKEDLNLADPSLGTPVWNGDSIDATPVITTAVASTWHTVTFSGVPDGSKAVWASVLVVGPYFLTIRKKGDTVVFGNMLAQIDHWLNAGDPGFRLGSICFFPLNASKQSEIYLYNAGSVNVYKPLLYYP